jgi:UDP-glucuronate decarboxylase
MKHFLVTGGAGFIGGHLCHRLLNEGHSVICLDNMVTGSPSNIEKFENRKFQFVCHDVVNPFSFNVDAIFNLACPASPIQYQKDPVKTLRTNILGAMNALDLAIRLKIPVLQASTSEVYGDPLVHPQDETYLGNVDPTGPRSCYDEGKRCAETLFFDYHRLYQANIKVVRIFNTYGPNMNSNDGRVVSNFIAQALAGRDITIYGSGDQTRSFCYIDDLVEGLLRMIQTPPEVTGPINLGNPEEYSISDLAAQVLRLTRSHSKLLYVPLPRDDPKRRRPDISKATSFLQWSPTVSLVYGLEQTIRYFENSIQLNAAQTDKAPSRPSGRAFPPSGTPK